MIGFLDETWPKFEKSNYDLMQKKYLEKNPVYFCFSNFENYWFNVEFSVFTYGKTFEIVSDFKCSFIIFQLRDISYHKECLMNHIEHKLINRKMER